jgi:hypothetical protein
MKEAPCCATFPPMHTTPKPCRREGKPTLTGTLRPLNVSTSSCSSRPLLLQKAARTSLGQERVQTADRYLGTLCRRAGVEEQQYRHGAIPRQGWQSTGVQGVKYARQKGTCNTVPCS